MYLAVKSSQCGKSFDSSGTAPYGVAPRQLQKETSCDGGSYSVHGMVCVAASVAHLMAFLIFTVAATKCVIITSSWREAGHGSLCHRMHHQPSCNHHRPVQDS